MHLFLEVATGGLLKKILLKISDIHWKTLVPESLFNEIPCFAITETLAQAFTNF